MTLTLVQHAVDGIADLLAQQPVLDLVERGVGVDLLDQVAQLGVLARGGLQGQRLTASHLGQIVDLLDRGVQRLRQLFATRLATHRLGELEPRAVQLAQPVVDVHGEADRARAIGDRTRDALADPPRRIGRELEPPAPVEQLDDDMRATGKRHPFLIRYDVGFDADGHILALDLVLAANGGNVADHTPAVLTRALCHVDNCYFLPNVRLRGLPCKTNTVSNTAFRGYGGPQAMLAIETIIEAVARRLGLAVDVARRRNFYGVGRNDVTPYGMKVADNIIERVLDELDRAVDLGAWRRDVENFNRASPVVKKGLATMPVKFGISFNRPALNQAGALVHVYTDGSVVLNHGGTEMGQGLFIKVAQVVAEVFQIHLDHVRVSATSTAKVPNTSATAASSGSDLNGMAAMHAAEEIKARMTAVAAEHFAVPGSEIVFASNRVYAGNRSLSFAELAALSWEKRVSLSAAGFYRTPKIHWNLATNTGRPFFYFVYGAAAAEVVVDTLSGETRVLRAELIQDCGRSLNPAIDLGQIEGAFVQGMGWLTSEELWWDGAGRLHTHGPSTYKIPGSRDVPAIFNARILADAPNREATIFRSKAIGEPPLMLAISVWLAIRDAIASLADYRFAASLDAPATPERVLAAVDEMRGRAAR